MSKSNSTSAPQTTSNTAYDDARVGVDGEGNRVLQDGSVDLGGGIFGGSAPIAAGSYQDTGDVFAPQFNLGGVDDRASAYDMYQNQYSPIYQPSGADISGAGNSAPISSNPPVAPAEVASSVGGDVAGAADRGGTVAGGNVSGAVASGAESVSQQFSGGGAGVGADNFGQNISAPIAGPVVGGDLIDSSIINAPVSGPVITGDVLDSPIINAPVSGAVTGGDVIDSAVVTAPLSGTLIVGDSLAPVVNLGSAPAAGGVTAPIVAGGDVEVGGAVVQGNNGPVTITDASPEIAAAAFASTEATSKRALDLAGSALSTVAASVRDPSEKVSSDAMKTLALVAGVVGLVAYLSQKKAA